VWDIHVLRLPSCYAIRMGCPMLSASRTMVALNAPIDAIAFPGIIDEWRLRSESAQEDRRVPVAYERA
jgi:hypothetical protein